MIHCHLREHILQSHCRGATQRHELAMHNVFTSRSSTQLCTALMSMHGLLPCHRRRGYVQVALLEAQGALQQLVADARLRYGVVEQPLGLFEHTRQMPAAKLQELRAAAERFGALHLDYYQRPPGDTFAYTAMTLKSRETLAALAATAPAAHGGWAWEGVSASGVRISTKPLRATAATGITAHGFASPPDSPPSAARCLEDMFDAGSIDASSPTQVWRRASLCVLP